MLRISSHPSLGPSDLPGPHGSFGPPAPNACGTKARHQDSGPFEQDLAQERAAPAKHRRSARPPGRRQAAPAAPPRRLALRHPPAPLGGEVDSAELFLGQVQQHMKALSGLTGQSVALSTVTTAAGGATTGFLLNVGHVGPFFPALAALAVLASTAGIATAVMGAKEARQQYLLEHGLLADQRRLRAEIDQRAQDGQAQPEDAARQKLVDALIEVLQARLSAYETACFRDAQSPHVQDTHHALAALARTLVECKAEHDQGAQELTRLRDSLDRPGLNELLRASITSDIARLERRQDHLLRHARQLRRSMKARLSPEPMKKGVKQRLAQASAELTAAREAAWARSLPHGPDVEQQIVALTIQRGYAVSDDEGAAIDTRIAQARGWLQDEQADQQAIAALEQEIRDLKQDLARLNRRIDKVLLDPLGDRGPAEQKFLGEVVVDTIKSAIDLGATANTAGNLWNIFQSFSSIPLMMPVWLLNLFSARLNIRGGKQDMASAAAAKGPAIDRAVLAAALLQIYQQDDRREAKVCQQVLRAVLQDAGNALHQLHQASQWGKTRKANALKDIFATLGLFATGIATLVTGLPVVIPFAVLNGASGVAYAGTGLHYLLHARAAKHHAKAQQTIAAAFVRRYGEASLAEFCADVAEGHASRWIKRLDALRQQLRATPDGRGLDPALFQPQALAASTAMAVRYLSHVLYVRARDRGAASPSVEADLVSRLAQAQGQPDPGEWTLESFASPDLYRQQIDETLNALFGSAPDANPPPLSGPRELAAVAARVNDRLVRHISHRNALSDDQTLWSWITQVAAQPENFGALLGALDNGARQRLRDQLVFLGKALGKEGVGPQELFALQVLSVQAPGKDKAHPLKAFPLLTEAPAPYLLELIADPSWLDAALDAPAPVLPAAAAGTQTVSQLIGAIKSVGREMRDGPSTKRPTRSADTANTGEMAAVGGSALPRHRRVGAWVKHRPHAVAKHFRQQRANPVGTPEKALDWLDTLEKKAVRDNDDTPLMAFLGKVLLAFAEAGEGPGPEPARHEAEVSALPDGVSETVRQRSELAERLRLAKASASTAAASLSAPPDESATNAKGREHLKKRLEQTVRVCERLERHVAPRPPYADDPRWTALLAPLAQKRAAAAA